VRSVTAASWYGSACSRAAIKIGPERRKRSPVAPAASPLTTAGALAGSPLRLARIDGQKDSLGRTFTDP